MKETHKTRMIAQWDDNFELEAESIVNIYRKRLKITIKLNLCISII